MKAERDSVVRFHYDLSDEAGAAVESSRDGEGIAVLVGHRDVVPGLDDALRGREVGDRFEVRVPPALGYGLRRDGWTQRVSKKHILGKRKPKAGEQLYIRTARGPRQVTVTKVGGSVIDVDLNHPWAGRTLVFDIEILEVRAAERDEIAHGHVHGTGGHGH